MRFKRFVARQVVIAMGVLTISAQLADLHVGHTGVSRRDLIATPRPPGDQACSPPGTLTKTLSADQSPGKTTADSGVFWTARSS